MVRVVTGSAVAEADVEKPVGTEREVAAVVVREGLRDERLTGGAAPAQIEPRRGVRADAVVRPPKTRDHGVAGAVGEVDEEAAAGSRVRREGQAKQALFAASHDRGRQIDEIGGQHRRAAHGANVTVLLHDELHSPIDGILHERDGQRES